MTHSTVRKKKKKPPAFPARGDRAERVSAGDVGSADGNCCDRGSPRLPVGRAVRVGLHLYTDGIEACLRPKAGTCVAVSVQRGVLSRKR